MHINTAIAVREDLARSSKLLCALASIGGGGIATLLVDMNLESVGLPAMNAELRRYVQGPIICHNAGGWGPEEFDGHPVHDPAFKGAIMAERTQIGLGISPWIVGPCELACVMYAATMASPLQSYATEIYLWAASYLVKAKFPDAQGTPWHADDTSAVKQLSDADILAREPYKSQYRELAHAIRRKVVAHQEGREREERHASKSPETAKTVVSEQIELFAA